MFKKNLLFGVAIAVGTLTLIGMILPTIHSVEAAAKLCNFRSPAICFGTSGNDKMKGTDIDFQTINACGGNDVIDGSGGNDVIMGDISTFTPDHCPGSPDGSPGSDRIYGGAGDDLISHTGCGTVCLTTRSDGHKDFIDCGPGNDEVFINVSVDHDVAINCETVNKS